MYITMGYQDTLQFTYCHKTRNSATQEGTDKVQEEYTYCQIIFFRFCISHWFHG